MVKTPGNCIFMLVLGMKILTISIKAITLWTAFYAKYQ